jgi:hypothetical protein
MTNRLHLRFVCLVALGLTLWSPASATLISRQLAAGVTFYQDINTDPTSAQIVNVIEVALASADTTVRPVLAGDTIYANDASKGRETVSSMCARAGALVAVNGDFFPFTGDPLGICIINGELVSESAGEIRAAIAFPQGKPPFFDKPIVKATATFVDGRVRQIDGINRSRETNQLIAYTETYGLSVCSKFCGTDVVLSSPDLPIRIGKTITATITEVRPKSTQTPIPKGGLVLSAGGPAACFLAEKVKVGDTVTLRFDVRSESGADWSEVKHALGGGPWLVKNGAPYVDYQSEKFASTFACNRHPRTAIGLTADNKLIIVTVDGRQSISRGISLTDLALLMVKLGAVNAINLDGGGSTTLSIRGLVVNSPSGGAQRPVANALAVFSETPNYEELPDLKISGLPDPVYANEGAQLSLTWGDRGESLTQEQLSRVIWGTDGQAGFVNQMGYFTPVRPGKCKVTALYGSQSVTLDVTITNRPALPSTHRPSLELQSEPTLGPAEVSVPEP